MGMQEKSSRNATYLAFIETRLEGYRPVPYICRKRFRDNSRSNGFPIGPKSHFLPHFGTRIWWSFSPSVTYPAMGMSPLLPECYGTIDNPGNVTKSPELV